MDDDALVDILQELDAQDFPIELAGYTSDDFEELLAGLTTMDDFSDAPGDGNQVDALAKPGYVYWLGGHRLICGNGTNPQDIEGLKYIDAMVNLWETLSGEKAVLLDTAHDDAFGGE